MKRGVFILFFSGSILICQGAGERAFTFPLEIEASYMRDEDPTGRPCVRTPSSWIAEFLCGAWLRQETSFLPKK